MVEIAVASSMGFFMIMGTLLGKRLVEKMDKEKFTEYVTFLLAFIGLTMVITG